MADSETSRHLASDSARSAAAWFQYRTASRVATLLAGALARIGAGQGLDSAADVW